MIWFIFGNYCCFSVFQFDFHCSLHGFLLFFFLENHLVFIGSIFIVYSNIDLVIIISLPLNWEYFLVYCVVIYAFQFEERISFGKDLFSLLKMDWNPITWNISCSIHSLFTTTINWPSRTNTSWMLSSICGCEHDKILIWDYTCVPYLFYALLHIPTRL